MKAAIFTLDTGAYKARAESAAASALKRMLEQVGFEVRAAGILPQNREVVASVIRKLAAYGVLVINTERKKEVLTIQVGKNENSKYH